LTAWTAVCDAQLIPKLRYAVLVLATLSAGSCGGQDEDAERPAGTPAAKPASSLKVIAPNTGGGAFRYAQDRLEAPAGRAELVLVNNDVHQHDVRIQTGSKCCYETGAKEVGGTDVITKGTAKTLVDLPAGEYVFFCSVAGHAEDGMQGRLTVSGGG
jgi:uncharacterized cupredoxin-like copper-binding protein